MDATNLDALATARMRWGLTNWQMAQLLGVALSTYEGWHTRGRVPLYIQHSLRAHLALNRATLRELLVASKTISAQGG